MNNILYQALRIKNAEKKVLSITQFIDTIRDYYAYDTKEIAFIQEFCVEFVQKYIEQDKALRRNKTQK